MGTVRDVPTEMELRLAYFFRANQLPGESIGAYSRRLKIGKGTAHRLLNAQTGITIEVVDCALAALHKTWEDILRTSIPAAEAYALYHFKKGSKPVRRHRKAQP